MKAACALRLALLCSLSSSCNSAPPRDGSAPGYAEAAFAVYPGTIVHYYDVDGTDGKAIRAALKSLGPRDHDGKIFDAATHWTAQWHWPGGANGGCDLAKLTYSFQMTVTLPQLHDRDRIDPALRAAWGRYMAALIDHELGHAKHAYDHRDDPAAAIKSGSCDTANAVGEAAMRELGKYDVHYDADTHHGATQGAVFP